MLRVRCLLSGIFLAQRGGMNHQLLLLSAAGFGIALVAACSSASTSPATTAGAGDAGRDAADASGDGAPASEAGADADAARAADATPNAPGACTLTLYPPDVPPRCQASLDKICCAEEQACADDATCAKVVECLKSCPAPRKDACINACVPAGGPGSAFDSLGTCSKNPAFDGGSECTYP